MSNPGEKSFRKEIKSLASERKKRRELNIRNTKKSVAEEKSWLYSIAREEARRRGVVTREKAIEKKRVSEEKEIYLITGMVPECVKVILCIPRGAPDVRWVIEYFKEYGCVPLKAMAEPSKGCVMYFKGIEEETGVLIDPYNMYYIELLMRTRSLVWNVRRQQRYERNREEGKRLLDERQRLAEEKGIVKLKQRGPGYKGKSDRTYYFQLALENACIEREKDEVKKELFDLYGDEGYDPSDETFEDWME
ncbi:Hypothetical predicted protein [Paramuricea clavata]|uniref:Uncharacterized protein n=1 Tax=Paramuricea clavata TaxID=317549 RepID=A0A7D9EG67_PARCT|nr:Hypothetical predicted protein [Paramuricea clavata]